MLPNIGSASIDARDEVVALWKACGLVASYNDPNDDFDRAVGGASSTVLVGRDETGTVRASVMAGHDGHRGWLYYVAVDPSTRLSGIGRQIVEAAERWLAQRGVPKVQLMVRHSNSDVSAFYDRLGYEETPRILMAKWLKQDGPA